MSNYFLKFANILNARRNTCFAGAMIEGTGGVNEENLSYEEVKRFICSNIWTAAGIGDSWFMIRKQPQLLPLDC